MPFRLLLVVLSSAVILLLAMPASAQVVDSSSCAEGRVATFETRGRCCWPEQTFSEATGRCEGAPWCPPGRTAHGDDCVGLGGTTPTYTAEGGPGGYPTEQTTAVRHGLVGFGVGMLLLHYTTSIVMGSLYLSGLHYGCSSTLGGVSFVPVLGPALALALSGGCFGGSSVADIVYGSVDSVVGLVGLIALIVGLTDRHEVVIEHGPDGDRRVSIDLLPTPTLRF